MLSQKEYQDVLWKYNNLPSSLPTKTRRNFRQIFRIKLVEHKYASIYPPFQPSPYELLFINYQASEETLIHLIDKVKHSITFTLDTESGEA